MLRKILLVVSAITAFGASVVVSTDEASARGGRGGGYRGGAVAVRGGGGAVAVRGGGYAYRGGRAHVSQPIARGGYAHRGHVHRGYAYRGYGYRPYGAAAAGVAVGAAAAGAAYYGSGYYSGCGYDAYGNYVCPNGYSY